MAQFSQDFSDIQKLQNNPQARQLAELLQSMDTSQMQQAMLLASSGQSDQAKQLLTPLLSDPRVQELLKQLGG